MKALFRYFGRKIVTKEERTNPHEKNFFKARFAEDFLRRYKFVNQYINDRRVLDIACGEGYGSFLMSMQAKQITGVDISDDDVKKATENYSTKQKNIKFICSDALKFLASNKIKFDVIVSFETIEHIEDYKYFLKLLYKNLNSSGVLIISTPNKRFSDLFYGGTINPYHLREFYTEELANIITSTLKVIPEVYRQRIINKKNILLSTFKSYILQTKSKIIVDNPAITGMDNIYVIKKPG